MEKFQADPNNDIVKEPYKGTGPVIAGAGYMYVSHLASVAAGIVTGLVAGYFAYKHVNAFVTMTRNSVKGSEGFRKKAVDFIFGVEKADSKLSQIVTRSNMSEENKAKFVEIIAREDQGFFQNLASKITGKVTRGERGKKFVENASQEKLSAAFMGGGMGGVVGYIGSTVWAGFKGGHEGVSGKRQFQRAQAEIGDLRERNDDLEHINDALHAKIIQVSTQLKDAPANKAEASSSISADDSLASTAEKPAAQLAKAEHQGTVETHERTLA